MWKIIHVLLLAILFSNFLTAQTITYPGSIPSFCEGGQIILTASAPPPTGSFTWKTASLIGGPYTNIGGNSPTLAVVAPGFYTVSVSGSPVTFYDTIQVKENPKPDVTFTFTGNNTCSGSNIPFTSAITSGTAPFTYAWTFGDGNTSAAANPSHQFISLGCATENFNVRLIVVDARGCRDTIQRSINVIQKPDVSIEDEDVFSPFSNCDNNPSPTNSNFSITINNSSASASCITSYNINWGDGNSQTNVSFPLSHTYTQLGAFNLVVTAFGANGCNSTKTYVVGNQANPAGGLATLGATTGLCVPSTIPFLITNWQNNSPGTIYKLDFGDGVIETLTHPLNGGDTSHTVNHQYITSSCPQPTFTATLTVINACDETPYTAGNIQIRINPVADFIVNPNPGCANTNICFINTTVAGSNGPTCSPVTIFLWDFGDLASGANNTSSLKDPCHVFSAPGVYTVTLTSSNLCGPTSFSQEVCITAPPVPVFTINNNLGCIPLSVKTTNTTNIAGNCSPTKWLWTVTYVATNCGTTSGFVFTNNTKDTSQNPQFRFDNPGTYTIQLAATNPCGTFTTTKTVVVKQPPNVTLPSFSNTCGTASITPTATVVNCGTSALAYEWTFTGGVPATSTNPNPGTIVYNTPGTYSISVAVTNECGTTTVTKSLTVDPVPVITVPSSLDVCSGEQVGPFNFSSIPTGASFTWTNNNTSIGLASNGSGNIPLFTTTGSGSATINVVGSNGLCSTPQSFSLLVNPKPNAPGVVSPVSYCLNATEVPLTANTTVGNTLLWYNTATGGVGSSNAPTPSTAAVNTKTYYVSQVNTATNCESVRSSISVSVNPIPAIGGHTKINPLTCGANNGSITLTGLTPSTAYSLHYLQNGSPVTVSINTTAGGIYQISGLRAGTFTDIYISANGCNSSMLASVILSDPTQPATPVISSVSPLCSGNNLLLSASSSTPSVSYNWTGPNTFTSNQQNPSIPNVTVAASGNYVVTATVNGCTSAAASVSVQINPTPATPVAGNNGPLCEGSNINLSSSTTSTGVLSYAWTGPNSFSSSIQNPVLSNLPVGTNGPYTIIVTATTNGQDCPSSPASTSAVVKPIPNIIDSSFLNPVQCGEASGSIILGGLVNGIEYIVNYNYNGSPQNANLTAADGGFIKIINLLQGTYNNIRVTLNGCTSNIVGPFVLNDPNPPPAPVASSNSAICSGQTLNLLSSSVAPGATNYTWSGPNGFNSTQQNPTIINTSSSNAGYYYVYVTINNCSSLKDSVLAVVNPLGALPIVSTPVTYCIDAPAVALTASTVAGGSLNWYNISAGGSPLPSSPVPSTTNSGTIAYYVSQSTILGCEGERAQINVLVNPDAKAVFTPVNNTKCAPFIISSSDVGLQTFPANNSVYNWYANNVFIGSGIVFPGYTINRTNDSIIIKLVTISSFGCKKDSTDAKFYTFKVPLPSFTISDSVGCGPLSILITNTTPEINLYNYYWDFGTGETSALQQPGNITFPINPTHNDTVYTIKLKIETVCDTIAFESNVRVKAPPRALFIPDRTSACSPAKILFNNTSWGFNSTYYWDFGDGATFSTTSKDTFTHIFTTGIVDTFSVQLVAVNECGSDTQRYQIIVAPNNIALIFNVNGPDNFGCAPHTVAIINNTLGGRTFEWNFGDGNTLSTTNNIDTVFHTYADAGVYTVTLMAENSCTDTTATRLITVYPKPISAFIVSSSTVCIGQSIQLTNQSSNANRYNWNFDDGTTSVLINPTHSFSSPGIYNVRLISLRNNPSGDVCVDTTFQQINVKDTLQGLFTMSDSTSDCAPLTVTFVNRVRPSVIASWNFGDGNTAQGDSVVHTYSLPGTYNVNLIVKVVGGCIYTKEETVIINGPSGTFNYDAGYVCLPGAVRFTASANNATTYFWNFGDGNTATSSSNSVYHTYDNPGNYLPSVILQNAGGCNFPIQGIDTIKADKIIGGFRYVAQQLCGSTAIQFVDTSSAFFGRVNTSWRFGDGNVAIGSNVNHTYTASGVYNIEMIVASLSGCSDTINLPINVQVNVIPEASIIADAESCAKETVTFSANIVSSDPLEIQQWTISNGVSGTGPSFSYLFNLPGTYNIRFVAGTNAGCFDTANHTIIIKPVPVVNATASTTICLGNSVQLNATGAPAYQWDPSEGLSCSTCPNPVATPTVSTRYVVSGTNALGCSGYDTVAITVIQPMQLSVNPNVNICIGQSANLLASGAATYKWTPVNGLNNSNISNPVATPNATTSYRVVGYDGFNCFTDTATVVVGVGRYPTVKLGPDVTLSTGTIYPLNTTVTNGPIAQWNWLPSTDLDCSTCPLPSATIKKDISYVVKITTTFGCTASDTINIKTFCENSQVFIPNAFTPDGDGINDILMVRGKGIVTVKFFRVFNRWGEVVFERTHFPPNVASYGWDGKIRGITGGPDVFVYTAEVVCENGTTFVYKGNTSIIK